MGRFRKVVEWEAPGTCLPTWAAIALARSDIPLGDSGVDPGVNFQVRAWTAKSFGHFQLLARRHLSPATWQAAMHLVLEQGGHGGAGLCPPNTGALCSYCGLPLLVTEVQRREKKAAGAVTPALPYRPLSAAHTASSAFQGPSVLIFSNPSFFTFPLLSGARNYRLGYSKAA